MVSNRRRRTGTLARSVFTVLLAFLVAFVAVAPVGATPTGVQCPTSPTQTITVPITCCGKIAAHIRRAPQPGEAGFVQCRCNEKRASEHQSNATQKLQLFMPVETLYFQEGQRLDPEWQLYLCEEGPLPQIRRIQFRPPAAA